MIWDTPREKKSLGIHDQFFTVMLGCFLSFIVVVLLQHHYYYFFVVCIVVMVL